ncbi:MAG: hypothetical protein IT507_14225 [Burkholderiaceae bacterium]|nr:hypothetical protein [Burkholderiaceae bacterium]
MKNSNAATTPPGNPPRIGFWFDFASRYSDLAAMRITLIYRIRITLIYRIRITLIDRIRIRLISPICH